MRRLLLCALGAVIPSLPSAATAQPSWSSAPAEPAPLELFHAITLGNLPTAETLGQGDFHYDISHRFQPTIDDGVDANFGLDGPVTMRMSLSYGVTDRLMLTLGRSNLLDNVDLQAHYRLAQWDRAGSPAALAARVGIAWNTQMPAVVDRGRADADNLQYVAQLIGNTLLLDGRLGLGLVPSVVYNSTIFSVDPQTTVSLGTYGQWFFSPMWSLWAEFTPALSGYQGILQPGELGRSHDSLAVGTALETGGHVFYLFLTNNTRLNPTQYLVGAPGKIAGDNLHLAFGITRYL